MNDKKSGFNFDNSYMELKNIMFAEINLNNKYESSIEVFNDILAEKLNLDFKFLKSEKGKKLLSGSVNGEIQTGFSQAYSGHQFGNFTNLGDGRALMLGEHISNSGDRFDIQLKGSGATPYSRRGDGKATLSSMLREYLVSEAMYYLHIPTSRSLAVLKTNEKVRREVMHEGAILVRVAKSHIRVGTFEFAYSNSDYATVKQLTDYSIKRHYPHLLNDENRYYKFLLSVIDNQASLIAKWQSIGFIHGVMNTDNVLISGETIDYGPCAFMDEYHPETVFSSIDRQGRYAYMNQPYIGSWNLARLAETLVPLLDVNTEKAVELANKALSKYGEKYNEYWLRNMSLKLGIKQIDTKDEALIKELLTIMDENSLDFTNTFRMLTINDYSNLNIIESYDLIEWIKKWENTLEKKQVNKEDAIKIMKKNNPAIIPRNSLVEDALRNIVTSNDYGLFDKLLRYLVDPYNYDIDYPKEFVNPIKVDSDYKTYCGT
jgi:uncharacterized protein YdiU (UPF0061 family)